MSALVILGIGALVFVGVTCAIIWADMSDEEAFDRWDNGDDDA